MQEILLSSHFSIVSSKLPASHYQSLQSPPGMSGSLGSSVGAAAHPLDSLENRLLCSLGCRTFQ